MQDLDGELKETLGSNCVILNNEIMCEYNRCKTEASHLCENPRLGVAKHTQNKGVSFDVCSRQNGQGAGYYTEMFTQRTSI